MGNIFLSILGISVSIGLIAAVLILLAPLLNKRYAAKWKYLSKRSAYPRADVSTQTRITYQTNGMRSRILRSGKPHGNRLYKTCSGFAERAV